MRFELMPCRQTPHIIILEVTLLLFFAAIWYGKITFYRDPGSVFFDHERAFERKYSAYREQEALLFRDITRAEFDKDPANATAWAWKAGKNAFLCGVFVTMGRETINGVHPLELSISSALAGLSRVEREDVNLQVYIANSRASSHPLWNSWMFGLLDGWTTLETVAYEGQHEEMSRLEAVKEFFTKTAHDFRYAINHCRETSQAPYVALFEGDILFADGWLARTKLAIQEIERKSKKEEQWQDLRLFNDEKGIGFQSNSLFSKNVQLIILGVSALLFGLLVNIRARSTFGRTYITNATILVACCISVPIFVLLFFQSGKSSLLPPKPGITVQNWGCCSQAIIMPRDIANVLAEFIVHQAGGPPDMSMNDFATNNRLKRFALNPVQVQHMGVRSLLTPDRTQRQLVWSVAFENLSPEKLRQEHEQNVRKLYGDKG